MSFLLVGGLSLINKEINSDLVTFKYAPSITIKDFVNSKNIELQNIKKEYDIDLNKNQMKQFNVDQIVLNKLIDHAMLSYLAKLYNFDISEEFVIKFIKTIPIFSNKDSNFDIEIFNSIIGNSESKKQEYISNIKQTLINNVIANLFTNSFNVPDVMEKNIINYLAEERIVDLVCIDLLSKNSHLLDKKLNQKDLYNFYMQNKNDFILPESRVFEYIKIDDKFISGRVTFSDKELIDHFNDNITEFGEGKNFKEVKDLVLIDFKEKKIDELKSELLSMLYDDISGGLNLSEIAQKYGLKINKVEKITHDKLLKLSNSVSKISNDVFHLESNEISLPIEVENEIFIVKVENITKSTQQEFKEVEKLIESMLKEKNLANLNLNKIEKFKSEYKLSKINNKQSNKQDNSISVEKDISFIRADISSNSKFPQKLIDDIFTQNVSDVTEVVKSKDKAYFAYIKSKITNKRKIKELKKDFTKLINENIRSILLEELIAYLIHENQTKIEHAKLQE